MTKEDSFYILIMAKKKEGGLWKKDAVLEEMQQDMVS